MWLITTKNRDSIIEWRKKDRVEDLKQMSNVLSWFFDRYIFPYPEAVSKIIWNFENITSRCNEITYDEELNAETYVLWHFLDRFHRFQIIFDELLKQWIINFPYKERKYPFDILDIWTWPWMSMYALSDFLNYLKIFWINNWYSHLWKLDYKIDYLERSEGFRNWLHRFTEWYNYWDWRNLWLQVPYHHWSFNDYSWVEFTKHYWFLDCDDDWWNVMKHRIIKYRFDLVVSSNFFTDITFFRDNIDSFKKVLQNLRNNWLLIIVWWTWWQYEVINQEIRDFCIWYSDDSWKFDAKFEQVSLESSVMSYSLQSDAWVIINNSRRRFFEIIDSYWLDSELSEAQLKHRKNIEKWWVKQNIKWNVMVFRKKSRLKSKTKKKA